MEQTVDGSCKTDLIDAVKQRVNQAAQTTIGLARNSSKENGNKNTSTRATSKKQSATSAKNE